MDLKQVAERLRKVKAAAFLCERDFAEVAKDAYGENVELELIQLDTSHAVTDWLAERDPTPLTVDALEALGFTQSSYHSHWELWSSGDGWSVKAMVFEKLASIFYSHTHSMTIRTIGELRTLARLAGVELKGGGS